MKRFGKKLFTLLMTLIMAVSILSVGVLATDDTHTHSGKVTFNWNILTNEGTGVCHCSCGDVTLETTTASEVVAPTCVEDGKTVYTATCTLNGEAYSSTYVKVGDKATGIHSGKVTFNWNILTNEGAGVMKCDGCGETIALETTTSSETVDATCTEDAKIVYTATSVYNGQTYSSTYIKVAGDKATGIHSGKVTFNWNILTNEGTGVLKCDSCGEKITLPTTTTSEVFAATCVEDGKTVYTATSVYNGETYSSTYIKVGEKATGSHTASDAVQENEKAATCEAAGSYDEVVYCSVCGDELSRETKTLAALGHTAGDAVKENVKAATCEAAGSYDEVVYCSACDEELSRETKAVAALGHKWDAGKVTKEPTATAKGEKVYTCANDSTHTKTEEIAATGTSSNAGLDDVPKTGDATNLFLFGGMMITALFSAVVLFFSAKKRNNH